MNWQPKWNAKTASWWSKARARGRTRFIVCWGVLGWGLSIGLGSTLLRYFFFSSHEWKVNLVINLIIFPLGGIFVGYRMWNSLEIVHQRYLGEELNDEKALSAKP